MKPAPTKIEEDGTAILDYVTPPSVRFGSGGAVTVGFDHGLVDRDGRPFSPGMFEAPMIQIYGAGEAREIRQLTHVTMVGPEPFKSFRGTVPVDAPIDLYNVRVILVSDLAVGHPQFDDLAFYAKMHALRVTP